MSGRTMLPPGSRYCRCASCGAYFGGERAFAVHRAGPTADRRCLAPSGMRERGMEMDSSGYWRRRVQTHGMDDQQAA